MVIMASGIARGRVRTMTTATAELPNMAAILQIIGWQRHAALVYRALPWYWTSMLWLIDSCQNKLSPDRGRVFSKVTADQLPGFRLDRGLKPGYYSGGEWGRTRKGKISEQIKPWRVVDFSSDIFLAQSSLPWYIAYVISTILVRLVGYSFLKFNWKK